MDIRRLGRTGIDVSRLALGCVTFGREIDQATSFDLLEYAIDSGINLLDTSEAYGGGQARAARQRQTGLVDEREATAELHSSELIIGRWLADRKRRQDVIVQTKLIPPLDSARVSAGIDACLKRLQTDYIDIMLFHAPDPVHPLSDGLRAFEAAMQAGKIRAIGCSNFSVLQLANALGVSEATGLPRLDIAQFNYNLAVREPEREMFGFCRSNEIAVETYSPLGAGFLTGKYSRSGSVIPHRSRFDVLPAHRDVYFHDEKFDAVDRLAELSRQIGLPVAQLAVAWVLQNQAIDSVLIGARRREHIASALAALEIEFREDWNRHLDFVSQSFSQQLEVTEGEVRAP